jgi:hypothetical protein
MLRIAAFPAGRRSPRTPVRRHPGIKAGQVTLGERAADRLRNGMDSWPSWSRR